MNTLSVRNGFYESEFNQIKQIGIGAFAMVYEAERVNIKQRFSIKRIRLQNNEQTNENINDVGLGELQNFAVLKGLKHKNIVRYYDLWLENETQNQQSFAFIQMELCDKSLHEILLGFKTDNNIYEDATLTSLGYYITSELFCQILEGVHYLHEQKPQIIHRNLNLYDILILINYPNKDVVKIADFGLSCLHNESGQSHTQDIGRIEYIAPEVAHSTIYDTRADIYSLGMVLKKIFLIDANRDYNETNKSSLLMNKYQNLKELLIQMTEHSVNRRSQTCRQILDEKQLWALDVSEFNPKQQFLDLCVTCDEEYKNRYEFKLIKLLIE